jgi:hypothetical protein
VVAKGVTPPALECVLTPFLPLQKAGARLNLAALSFFMGCLHRVFHRAMPFRPCFAIVLKFCSPYTFRAFPGISQKVSLLTPKNVELV